MTKKNPLVVGGGAPSSAPADAAGRDLINQLLGQAQMASSFSLFSRTVAISKLAIVKENKLYQQLKGVAAPNGSEMSGTWADFCGLLGMSVDKADEDIANARAFGEAALEQMQRVGIGYRELRKYRKLPEDERTALIEAAQTGDKEAFVDLAETIISKHAKEKAELQEAAEESEAQRKNLEVQLGTAEAKLTAAEKKLAKGVPDRADHVPLVVAELRAEITALIKKAELAVDSFGPLGADLMNLVGTEAAHAYADATIRLAVVGLSAVQLQVAGVLKKFASSVPDANLPTEQSHLTLQEVAETAERWTVLTRAHEHEKALREWEAEQKAPRGKGRPKAKPEAPKGGK